MGRDPMSPEELLAPYPPILRATAESLRALVQRTLPDAIEAVRPGWRLIGYDVPIGRRTRYVAFVWPEPEHVHLGFEHGIFMDDPDGILGGSGLRKVRFVTLSRPGQIRDDVLERLVHEAVRVASMDRSQRVATLLDRDAVRTAIED
ncbi:MAG TPA: DUF1801 domain-containing protein [Candidatus Limnocylindrales bacterium]|nr:DUF1801 domain-containing protein [Candidatus Limnocylindrales bacterium]